MKLKAALTAVLFSGISLSATTSWAANYQIDPSHSSVGFKVKHLAISTVPGKFLNYKGSFTFDPANIPSAKAEATITTTSVDTAEAKRDDHLRGADFFDTAKYPEMSFKTTKIEKVTDTQFKAHGDLTIRGVTQPVVLDVTYGGAAKDLWGKDRAAFVATTKINRKSFGLTWNKVLETGSLVVGDEVEVVLEIQGVKA
jgi:polyisoprenoid-binding protein YceI